MNAYIQNEIKGVMNGMTASVGLADAGCYVTHTSDIKNFKLTDSDVFYGNVNWIKDIIFSYGYKHHQLGEVPLVLRKFAGRAIHSVTLAEALEQSKTQKVFIKPPAYAQKAFTGFVIGDQLSKLEVINYPLDEQVLMSDVCEDIVSEWRCFIYDREIVGAQCYKGDFKVTPDYDMVNEIRRTYDNDKTAIAYACDVYVTSEGGTYLMELNDMMCLGLYGLHPKITAAMLIARWEQIHKKKST